MLIALKEISQGLKRIGDWAQPACEGLGIGLTIGCLIALCGLIGGFVLAIVF